MSTYIVNPPDEWRYEVSPACGRWLWDVAISHGWLRYERGWTAFGTQARAIRKAKRIIARRKQREQLTKDRTVKGTA